MAISVRQGRGPPESRSLFPGSRAAAASSAWSVYGRSPAAVRRGMRCTMQPRIDRTQFGSVTIDGTVFEHDVLIRLGGQIKKRKKKLSQEAAAYLERHRCQVELLPTPEVIPVWNQAEGAVIAMLHVTC